MNKLIVVEGRYWDAALQLGQERPEAMRLRRTGGSVPLDAIIVGENNPYNDDPKLALWPSPPSAAGGRLARILGLGDSDLQATWRANLCREKWTAPTARAKAALLLGGPWQRFVLLGSKVRDAFAEAGQDTTVGYAISAAREAGTMIVKTNGVSLLLLPHPSGRNRAWNEAGAVGRAREAFAEFVK